jgi:dihydroorotase-like cyclic amidohydrolase
MATTFVIKDVRIFDGTSEIPSGFVHVSNGKILSVGTDPSNIPSGIKVISKPNHTLLPGFIDAHNHCDKGNELALYQGIRFGVTTIMDLHNEMHHCNKLKKIARENLGGAADFKYAGLAATIDNGWPAPIVTAHDKSEEVWDFCSSHD